MAPRETTSVIALVSSLLVLTGVLSQVSALKDSQFIDSTKDSAYDEAEIKDKDLPVLLLGYLMTGHGKMSPETLAEVLTPHNTASGWKVKDASNLTPVLKKLLSSLSGRQQQAAGLPGPENSDGGYEVMVSKRGGDSLSGVMPPLNEFCRLMNVQCY
ncbi:hypothetical protein BsWGS_17116 [Bradybaena similaris]